MERNVGTELRSNRSAPDLMLEWLTARNEILEAVGRREAADRQLEALREEEFESHGSHSRGIGGSHRLNRCALDGQPLRIVMEAATAVQSQHEKDAAKQTAIGGAASQDESR